MTVKTCWVVMSVTQSPIYITTPRPKFIFSTKKEAFKCSKEHNDNPRTYTVYYVEKAEIK